MKTKHTLLLCFCSFLFCGCFKEKQSVYGTYSNQNDVDRSKWKVVVITEPNFFTYKTFMNLGKTARETSKHRGKYTDHGEYLFLETDTENNRGYMIYLTDKTFNKVQIGTSEWRETLYRVR